MIWLTNPVPDFDAEKRRRWYAFVMGAVGGVAIIGSFTLNIWISSFDFLGQEDPLWVVAIALFGFWLFFFMLKYAAAYALWYKAYNSRKRAIFLSILAVFSVYFLIIGAVFLSALSQQSAKSIEVFFKALWEFHKRMYGVPYVAAAIIGWRFARPAPDARDSF